VRDEDELKHFLESMDELREKLGAGRYSPVWHVARWAALCVHPNSRNRHLLGEIDFVFNHAVKYAS
jgi:hypothetical protein